MAVEQSMTHAIMQEAIEAIKAVIIAVREAENVVKNAGQNTQYQVWAVQLWNS